MTNLANFRDIMKDAVKNLINKYKIDSTLIQEFNEQFANLDFDFAKILRTLNSSNK